MANPLNPDKLSEFAKIYYQITDYDVTGDDATILADASWEELCVISVSPSANVNSYDIKDRCVERTAGVAPGREEYKFDMTMNLFRQNPNFALKAWNTAMDNGDIVSFLILNSTVADTETWGVVGNFLRIDESEDQPEEGLITVNYTFGCAARSQYTPLKRRIYGADVV